VLKYSVGLNVILAVIIGVYVYSTFKANVKYEEEKNKLTEKYETAQTIEILEGEKVSDKAKQQISELLYLQAQKETQYKLVIKSKDSQLATVREQMALEAKRLKKEKLKFFGIGAGVGVGIMLVAGITVAVVAK
jgi:hypothetical protein